MSDTIVCDNCGKFALKAAATTDLWLRVSPNYEVNHLRTIGEPVAIKLDFCGTTCIFAYFLYPVGPKSEDSQHDTQKLPDAPPPVARRKVDPRTGRFIDKGS